MVCKSSKDKVKVSGKRECLPGECAAVDTISLSYKSNSGCCCIPRRRVITSLRFPAIDAVEGVGADGVRTYTSTTVATVNVAKMMKKEGNTPVRVCCLAGATPILVTEMELADLLQSVELTRKGHKTVLIFSLLSQQNRQEAFGAKDKRSITRHRKPRKDSKDIRIPRTPNTSQSNTSVKPKTTLRKLGSNFRSCVCLLAFILSVYYTWIEISNYITECS